MRRLRVRFIGIVAILVLALGMAGAAGADTKHKTGDESEHENKSKGQTVNVQILGVNDFHGNLEPPYAVSGRMTGGAAYLAAYLEKYSEANKNTIRVHAGDMVGASPLISSYFHDEPTVDAMNMMEFDIGTLGNHEFDEGGREMMRLLNGGQRNDGKQYKDGVNTSNPEFEGADFPYVAANTVYASSGKPVLPPYKIIKKQGVKIGFIGVTTMDTPNIVVPDAVAPYKFLDISDTVNRYAAELQKKGVQSIVVLAHAGGYQKSPTDATGEILTEAAQMSDAVDVIVAGHSHSYLNTRVGNKLIVEGYKYGTAFDQVNLEINRKSGDVVKSNANVVTTFDDAIQPDKDVAQLVAKYKERIAPVSERTVGTAANDITRNTTAAGESALGDLIADGQKAFAKTDFAFMNPGGIRADIQAGKVTYGELFSVQPFDNGLVKMELTGDQIYRLLEQQFQNGRTRILQIGGLKYTYNASNPAGQRITSITLPDGTPLNRAATYTVAANGYIATGGDGFTVFKEGKNTTSVGGDLEALVDYIESLTQPFTAPNPNMEKRITKQG